MNKPCDCDTPGKMVECDCAKLGIFTCSCKCNCKTKEK